MKKSHSLLLPILIAATTASQAAIVNVAHFGLGEPGTVTGGSSPFSPLIDSIGNHHIENGAGLTATLGTTGVVAPGSSAYLAKTQAGGWYDTDAGANSLNLFSDWAAQIWVRPGTAAGTLAFQTDSQGGTATGETIWLANDAGGTFAFGTGTGGTSGKILSSATYTVGTWYRVGIVNHNGGMHYFVDGNEVASAARGGTLSDLQIGWAAGGNPTSGAFDELNVWTFDSGTDSLGDVAAAMNAVPEPSAALLGGLLLVGLLRRRRA